jgi:[ribosomal protein S18]-alanine N-acetyltransferase
VTNTGPVISVRQAVPEDLAPVERIERASFSDPWSREALWSELCRDAMRLPLVAEKDGQVCGYVMAWRVADQLHILNIATDPKVLRCGVASALLLAAARDAGKYDILEITLEVRRTNYPARSFYKEYGFVETGVRPGYYQETGEDAIIMTARLAEVLSRH